MRGMLSISYLQSKQVEKNGIIYLYKEPKQFDNVFIRPGAGTLVIYNLFVSVN